MPLEHRKPNHFSGQDISSSSQYHPQNRSHIQPASPFPAAQGSLAQTTQQNTEQVSNDDTLSRPQQQQPEWTTEIGRYGLTSTTRVRDHTADQGRISHRAQANDFGGSPNGRPALQGKRPSEGEEEDEVGTSNNASPVVKKARLIAPGRIDLGNMPSTPASLNSSPGLISPLFFSMSSKPTRHTLGRPPSWSAAESAASMMTGEPNKGVTTVRLPMGQISGSPARSLSTAGSWASLEACGTSRSPDNKPLLPSLQLLKETSVLELLEQDERPTFIVDLANGANFSSGTLQVLFLNASLRASPGLDSLISGDNADPKQSADFSRFKSWVLSFVKDNGSLDVWLPSHYYGGITWTCSTLRRRFRFVSGNTSAVSNTPTSPSSVAQASSVLDQRARGPTPMRNRDVSRERPASEVDYFGSGMDRPSSAGSSYARSHSEPRSKPDTVLDTILGYGDEFDRLSEEPQEVKPTFDWTRISLDTPNIPAFISFARSVDWASTPLGPVEEWPSELRSMANMIIGSPHPAAMYWGPQYVAIYNEAYIALAGQKHPDLMGRKYQDAWPEIWPELESVFEAAWNSGQATMKHDDRLFLTRNGYVEETYFSWSIIPLVGGDGSVVAIYNPAFENTRRKIMERRLLALNEVGEKISLAKDVKEFWARVREGLETSEDDVPFALIYSVADNPESEVSSMDSNSSGKSPPVITLEGSLGAPDDHPAAPATLDLRISHEGFAPYMREVMADPKSPLVLRTDDGTLPQELIDGLAWRGFGDPCRTVVVFPVHPTTGDTVVGFIVLGVNPRRPYDEDYELFVGLLVRQLATSLASVVLFEEEIKRGQKAARLAALETDKLSMELNRVIEEATESEFRFTRMTAFAPVGMFIADGAGRINYCNDTWYEISRHPKSTGIREDTMHATNTMDVWMQSIRDEDRPSVEEVWRKLVEEKAPITHEFRFKNSRAASDGHPIDTWVLMSAYPEKHDNGDLKSIFGCITDISQQKWAENFQKLRREEALELKRQQENFIDITSHELRNPLSAVLQSADEVTDSIARYRSAEHSAYVPKGLNSLLDSLVEAANTITECASHQKRIVDDILTLSKLDSKLLPVTPVDVQPVVIVENVLKMFEPELRSNDIKGEFRIDQSFLDLGFDWYKLDPSRLRQVLINLMTNAIKFTRDRETRTIVISLGASRDISKNGLLYFPRRVSDEPDPRDEPDWGIGEKIDLTLAVSDTGSGISEEDQQLIFKRFQQASPRTHVRYGGSGLGLFICRTLAELQGGQIGVESKPDVGSTFVFYIKSRQVDNPEPEQGVDNPTPTSSPLKQPTAPTRASAPKLQYSTQQILPPPSQPGPSTAVQAPNPDSDSDVRDPKAPSALDVLIVEDNVVNSRVLGKQLRRSGHNTLVANHGVEALEALAKSRFWVGADEASDADGQEQRRNINISVILMDLEMPVMDGMTCAKKIRELERKGTLSTHIPIIAVTAYARPEQIASAKAAGMDFVISKPFRIQELMPKVKELVAKFGTYPVTDGGDVVMG